MGNKQAIVVTVSMQLHEKVVGAEVIGSRFSIQLDLLRKNLLVTPMTRLSCKLVEDRGNAKPGTYIVEAQVSALGYKDKLAKTMFNVNSNSVSTNNPDNMNPTQDNNNDGSTDNMNNFAQHIIENVKRKIKSDGINIEIPLPIPFG